MNGRVYKDALLNILWKETPLQLKFFLHQDILCPATVP